MRKAERETDLKVRAGLMQKAEGILLKGSAGHPHLPLHDPAPGEPAGQGVDGQRHGRASDPASVAGALMPSEKLSESSDRKGHRPFGARASRPRRGQDALAPWETDIVDLPCGPM